MSGSLFWYWWMNIGHICNTLLETMFKSQIAYTLGYLWLNYSTAKCFLAIYRPNATTHVTSGPNNWTETTRLTLNWSPVKANCGPKKTANIGQVCAISWCVWNLTNPLFKLPKHQFLSLQYSLLFTWFSFPCNTNIREINKNKCNHRKHNQEDKKKSLWDHKTKCVFFSSPCESPTNVVWILLDWFKAWLMIFYMISNILFCVYRRSREDTV